MEAKDEVKVEESKDDERAFSDSSDSDEDSEDEMAEEVEFKPVPMTRGRRNTVMAAPLKVAADWRPPVYPKTDAQRSSIAEIVSQNVLMKSLEDKDRDIIIAAFEDVEFPAGKDVIVQGAEGDRFYVVQSGAADIFVSSKRVGAVGAGDSFGELALLYDAPRAATVTASEPLSCWALDRMTFKSIIQDATIKRRRQYEEFVGGVEILSTLNELERMTIADALEPMSFSSGEVIIEEGSEGNSFFMIESGEAKVTKTGEDGEVSKRLGDGTYFGEIALLQGDRRHATVTATADTRCLTIDRRTFKRLLGPLEETLRRNMDVYDSFVSAKK